jgi:hypothetical protein
MPWISVPKRSSTPITLRHVAHEDLGIERVFAAEELPATVSRSPRRGRDCATTAASKNALRHTAAPQRARFGSSQHARGRRRVSAFDRAPNDLLRIPGLDAGASRASASASSSVSRDASPRGRS